MTVPFIDKTPFTDITAALEEAQFIANTRTNSGQFKSAYLIQFKHMIFVRQFRNPIPEGCSLMATVKPSHCKSILR